MGQGSRTPWNIVIGIGILITINVFWHLAVALNNQPRHTPAPPQRSNNVPLSFMPAIPTARIRLPTPKVPDFTTNELMATQAANTSRQMRETLLATSIPREVTQPPIHDFASDLRCVYVTAETLNVRVGPGTNYEQISQLQQGDEEFRVGGGNGWHAISIANEDGNYVIGWVSGDSQFTQVSYCNPFGTAERWNKAVRETREIVACMNKGDECELLLPGYFTVTTSPSPQPQQNCDPSYPTLCLKIGIRDLDCEDIWATSFPVNPPDPHKFDRDTDGVGCEPLP